MLKPYIRPLCIAALILALAACRATPAEPIVIKVTPDRTIPRPTVTAEPVVIEICKCAAKIKAEAWVDLNENGQREPEEVPLKGVTFRVEWYDTGPDLEKLTLTSNASGYAGTAVTGCGCDDAVVYAAAPSGYRLTTPDHCRRECSFGFAALPSTPKSLREANLRGVDLRGENLTKVDLSSADLNGADLSGANLLAANLCEANLSGANMRGAHLIEANLRGADLRDADLSFSDLSKANLSEADLRGANLSGANLFWPNLRGAVIDDTTRIEERWRLAWEIVHQGGKGRDLGSVDLNSTDLSGADLRSANLREADLSNANLSGTDLTAADLFSSNLRGTTIDDTTKIEGRWRLVWEIVNQGGKGRYLGSAELSGADLQWADLSWANLNSADLSLANLSEANLSHADLRMADLREANLSVANLDEADLRGADLRETNLRYTFLYSAKYDQNTKWPEGFDPAAQGAILVE